jgi:ABC-2 type transport system permease protein
VVLTTVAVGCAFGLWPRGSWAALLLAALPLTLASLAVGVLLSTLATNSVQAVFVGVFVMLPSFILSGAMFPHQLMPPNLRQISYVLPLHWYQVAVRRVIERGAGVADIAVPILMMWALFAGLLVLIRWRLRPRLA